jgi:hypothetical protein
MLCGFRQGKSPLDHLFRFETFIRNAMATKEKEKKEHAVVISFDLKKAYTKTCNSTFYINRHVVSVP